MTIHYKKKCTDSLPHSPLICLYEILLNIFISKWALLYIFYVPATKWPGHNSVTHVTTMLWDIDLIFGIWVYNDELQIKFTFCSGPLFFGRVMALKFGQIFSCHHFISLWFEILTWFLVWECIIISYRSIWNSFRLNDFWPT